MKTSILTVAGGCQLLVGRLSLVIEYFLVERLMKAESCCFLSQVECKAFPANSYACCSLLYL